MTGGPSQRWELSRRQVLGMLGLGALGAGSLAGCTGDDDARPDLGAPPDNPPATPALEPVDHGPAIGGFPFGLGVASGDPDDTSVVLWTWVDRPPERDMTVEVARDADFELIVERTPVTADPEAGMTVRVLVAALEPDTRYWYRFVADGHLTAPARTRTTPAAGAVPDEPLALAHLSCQRFSSGFWTALDDVARQAPDVVVHCGDYVYETDTGPIRPVAEPAPTTLDGYRALWRRYKSQPELQAAHAVAPWLMVWDDHEVENNYQGDAAGDPPDGQAFLDQRAAAYRAWWEMTPTRLSAPEGPDLRIHRTVDWGGLARFVLLDTRQHRDDQPCSPDSGDVGARCDASETISMLGAEQEAWFADEAVGHRGVWTAVVQQVVVHQWRFLPGNRLWNLDQWDGYPAARRRLLDVLAEAPSPVVLTGDVHSSWVADLRTDFDDGSSPVVGSEFVAPGISSDVPEQLRGAGSIVELSSPHIVWSETRRRGWVLHEITADEWTATYRLVDDASVPDSPVAAERSFTVSADRRGVT